MTTEKIRLWEVSIQDIEKLLNFTYQSTLTFEDTAVEESIRHGCRMQRLTGIVPKEEIERGERLFQFSHPPKLSLRYISDQVGWGLYAEETIHAGLIIGEYAGVIRREGSGDYIFGYAVFDGTTRYILDGEQGNYTRFINHSNRPNLVVHDAYLDGIHHTVFETAKTVTADTHLTFNYGPRYWEGRAPPTSIL